MQDIGQPAAHSLASGETAEVIRLGGNIGLGVATSDGAAMAELTKDEARILANELLWQADATP